MLTATHQAMPMASKQVVERVPERRWEDSCECHETPSTAEVPGDSQSGGRPSEKPLTRSVRRRLVPNYRVHPFELGVSRENRTTKGAVEGRKLKGPLPIVPEDELHALGTESAGAIVKQDRPR